MVDELKDVVEISDMTVRTTPGLFYVSPKAKEVEQLLRVNNNLKIKNWDVVADVINLLSDGGNYTPLTEDAVEAERYADEHIPKTDDSGRWIIPNANGDSVYTVDKSLVKRNVADKRNNQHQNTRGFLAAIDEKYGFQNMPGKSPLQKALSLMRLLDKVQSQKNDKASSDMESDKFAPNKTADKIVQALKDAKTLKADEQALLGNKPEGDSVGQGGGGEEQPELKALAIAEDMLEGKDLVLKVARHLSTLSKMTVGRSHERIPDPEGRAIDPRRLEDFNDLPKLSSTEWAYSANYRNYRIVTGQARMYERVREVAKKQCLYMIVDCSGSMDGDKTFIAGGCVMRGLRGVYSGDAELYLRFFDTSLHTEMVAKTPEEAKKVMYEVLHGNHSGGGTQIAKCAKLAITEIKKLVKTGLSKPELMIVTDGEDDVSALVADDFAGIKLHAIIVQGEQKRLIELAKETGGIGISVTKRSFN